MFTKNSRLDQIDMNHKIHIRVPGTSANLGPGFDLLGMALKIYNHFYFTIDPHANYTTLRIDNTPLPFAGKEDLLLCGYEKYFELFLPKIKLIPYNVKMDLNLPFKGGLGSSASALTAGFALGNFLHKKHFSKKMPIPGIDRILYELAMMEGHPDNTTPAMIGGFVFSYFHNGKLIFFKDKFPTAVSLFLFIPQIEVSTNDSRKKLPDKYPVSDIIYNMSRIATWHHFIKTKDFSHLQRAVEDKIHTPYRIKPIPLLGIVGELCNKLGATYSLSGSGPSVLIYTEKKNAKKFLEKFQSELSKRNTQEIAYTIQKIETDNVGVLVKETR